jgi:hypothetical protein
MGQKITGNISGILMAITPFTSEKRCFLCLYLFFKGTDANQVRLPKGHQPFRLRNISDLIQPGKPLEVRFLLRCSYHIL